jgi:hypothetical protein
VSNKSSDEKYRMCKPPSSVPYLKRSAAQHVVACPFKALPDRIRRTIQPGSPNDGLVDPDLHSSTTQDAIDDEIVVEK